MEGSGSTWCFLEDRTNVYTLLAPICSGQREDRKRLCPVKRLLKTWSHECGGQKTPCAYQQWNWVFVTPSCPTLCDPMDCSPPGSSVHRLLQAKNTGVGGHSLCQRIFPTQGLNPGLLHCRQFLYRLSHQVYALSKYFLKLRLGLLLPKLKSWCFWFSASTRIGNWGGKEFSELVGYKQTSNYLNCS